MAQTLVVEFEVESEVKRDFGYVEKYLKYAGQEIPYKAIVRNGKFLAIVSRRYLLIENEKILEICKRIADKKGFEISHETYPPGLDTRIHVKMMRGDVGVVVHNSVDGSCSLRVDAMVKISKNTSTIFRIKNLKEVCRKHYGTAKILVEDLEKIITAIMDEAKEFKYFIDKLESYSASDFLEELQVLEEILPKRYVKKVLATAKVSGMTLKEFYERIANKIWNAKIDMKTKIDYFNVLNNLMFAVTGWE